MKTQFCPLFVRWWSLLPESEEFKPYRIRRKELSVAFGCLLLGSRVVVPQPCRQAVIKELHVGHQGICKMKSLARSYVWWPGVDSDIESCVKDCVVCQESRPAPTPAPLHPWEYPEQPWLRLHLHFAGPFMGNMFLVIIEVDWRPHHEHHNLYRNYPEIAWHVCNSWFAEKGRNRQWSFIRQCWIQRVYEGKWYSPCNHLSISPVLQRTCRESCTNHQASSFKWEGSTLLHCWQQMLCPGVYGLTSRLNCQQLTGTAACLPTLNLLMS